MREKPEDTKDADDPSPSAEEPFPSFVGRRGLSQRLTCFHSDRLPVTRREGRGGSRARAYPTPFPPAPNRHVPGEKQGCTRFSPCEGSTREFWKLHRVHTFKYQDEFLTHSLYIFKTIHTSSPCQEKTRGTEWLIRGSKTSKSASFMGKSDFVPGVYGTSLSLRSFAHQTQHNCGLDYDGSAENKIHSPGDKIVAGGVLASTFYKDHYKAAVEQLAALSLSKNTRRAQLNSNSNKQGAFHSWSYIHHQGNNAVSRKTFLEMPSSSSDTPINLINTNPTLVGSQSVNRYQSVSYPGIQQTPLENSSRNGDGDFFRKTHEATTSDSYPATNSSSDDMLSLMKLNWKTGNSYREKVLAEEKDACEDAKNRAVLLKYLKNANLNLRPEPIKDTETSSSAECDTFSYPDFLPPPFNTLDLQKLSLSKWDDWKLSFEPPLEGSLDKLISRLVEMERLQHLTILKERAKELSASPTMALSNRPTSTKDMKQLKAIDISYPQAAFDGDFHNFDSCVQEPDISKCTCRYCHNKWNSGLVSPLHSKHLRASCNKCTKASVILDSSNIVARRSLSCCGSSAKIRSAVKMSSPNTAVAFSLHDNESSKGKQPRTRRKPCRKNVALMGKPSHSQRLKSLSVMAKPKYTQIEHQ
ncbi:protein FAM217A [Eublepharis macularius]|uniref:Protein FAM217A n=1 Tax=Eublepharis macularius TaxID=481883 RepID=A0AA97JQT1_EUBMA|nr:protein FAM217A [Eublepharis macularius]